MADNIKSSNITPVAHQVTTATRWQKNGHKGGVIWLTGLSASGKSTLSILLERRLFEKGWRAYTLDGDNIRGGLSADLGFSPKDRSENIRRVAETAALLADIRIILATIVQIFNRKNIYEKRYSQTEYTRGEGG